MSDAHSRMIKKSREQHELQCKEWSKGRMLWGLSVENEKDILAKPFEIFYGALELADLLEKYAKEVEKQYKIIIELRKELREFKKPWKEIRPQKK